MSFSQTFFECPICIGFKSDIRGDYFVNTSCGHLFHFSCIKNCLAIKRVCPSCNQDLALNNLTKINGLDPTGACDMQASSGVIRVPTFSKEYYEFEITLLGESGAGKTCLLKRYVTGKFDNFTKLTTETGIHFQYVYVAGNLIKLKLWDASGQERFRCINQNHLRNSHGVLLVHSYNTNSGVAKIQESTKYWNDYIEENGKPGIAKLLVGNKTDIEESQRTWSTRQAQNIADSYGLPFYETSAKEYINVDDTFTALVVEILSKVQTNQLEYKGPTRENLIKLHEKQPKKQEGNWKKGFKKFLDYIDCLGLFESKEEEEDYKLEEIQKDKSLLH